MKKNLKTNSCKHKQNVYLTKASHQLNIHSFQKLHCVFQGFDKIQYINQFHSFNGLSDLKSFPAHSERRHLDTKCKRVERIRFSTRVIIMFGKIEFPPCTNMKVTHLLGYSIVFCLEFLQRFPRVGQTFF